MLAALAISCKHAIASPFTTLAGSVYLTNAQDGNLPQYSPVLYT